MEDDVWLSLTVFHVYPEMFGLEHVDIFAAQNNSETSLLR